MGPTMQTLEIPRNQWVSFFNNFSRNHHGWAIKLEVLHVDIGAQVEAHDLPFLGIVADLRPNGKDQIAIIIEASHYNHMSHIIAYPTHVRIEQNDRGTDEALQIESASGETAIINF
jgi:hypothetical protein